MTDQELLSLMDDHDCLGTTLTLDIIVDAQGEPKLWGFSDIAKTGPTGTWFRPGDYCELVIGNLTIAASRLDDGRVQYVDITTIDSITFACYRDEPPETIVG